MSSLVIKIFTGDCFHHAEITCRLEVHIQDVLNPHKSSVHFMEHWQTVLTEMEIMMSIDKQNALRLDCIHT